MTADINYTFEFRTWMEIADDQFEHTFAIGSAPMYVCPFGYAMFGDECSDRVVVNTAVFGGGEMLLGRREEFADATGVKAGFRVDRVWIVTD
jgi:hypothetical protein